MSVSPDEIEGFAEQRISDLSTLFSQKPR